MAERDGDICMFSLQIPMVDSELRKASGEEGEGSGEGAASPTGSSSASTLVTAHGTYATQSALTATPLVKEEKM